MSSRTTYPTGTTLWVFREKLAQAGLVEKLFDRFNQHLNAKGDIARGGQMVDATIVPVPYMETRLQRLARKSRSALNPGATWLSLLEQFERFD